MARRGPLWTPDEDRRLAHEYLGGEPLGTIAEKHGRTVQAIALRANHLRLRRRTALPLADRFWAKVDRRGADECWLWRGWCDSKGYGRFHVPDPWRSTVASRVSWELSHGPIPDAMAVMHRCDNPPCVNPAHLELGTLADNNRDMIVKGRNAHGPSHPMARLTTAQVREIKRRLAAGESQGGLARAFGVGHVTVHCIATGKTWREVTV